MNERLLHEENIDELFQRNSGALALERFFPRSVRTSLMKAFAAALFFCLFVLLILFLVGTTSLEHELITLVSENIALLIGLASLFSGLYLVLFALELFSLSAYFGGLKRSLSRTELYARPDGVSFDLLL